MMTVELRHLRYFVAVAEAGSLTGAARRIHVSQQVLSSQIRQLEDVVETRLLERTSRGVILTPAGEAFLHGAQATLASLDRGVAAARGSAGVLQGRLSVGLNMAAGSDAPTAFMADFQREHPDIELTLRFFDLRSPASGLLDGSSDVAFVRPPIDAPGLKLENVTEEPCVFVLPADHPLTGRAALSLEDVTGMAWVAAETSNDGCNPATWRDAWLFNGRRGGDKPIIGATASNIDECREHVLAGKGITLVPACAETHYPRPGLAFVPSAGLPPATTAIAWRGNDSRPVVQRFVQETRGTASAAWFAESSGHES